MFLEVGMDSMDVGNQVGLDVSCSCSGLEPISQLPAPFLGPAFTTIQCRQRKVLRGVRRTQEYAWRLDSYDFNDRDIPRV